jgi:phospholipase D-like protein/uncharacterized protein DUF2510
MTAGVVAFGGAVIGIAAVIYWIYALVEVARIPEWQFDAVESNKLFWIAVVFFLNVVGALFWLFTTREWVLAAGDGRVDIEAMFGVPAGWYPQPGVAALRWWDGTDWTDRYDTWSGAPDSSPVVAK